MGIHENPPYYLTAYSLAVKRGFVGTLDEWLASLRGDKVEMRYLQDKLQWRYIKNTADGGDTAEDKWKDLMDMSEIRALRDEAKTAATHARYFIVDEDGMLSLKPEYRGAATEESEYALSDNGIGKVGSKNSELPRHLVIPDEVDGVTVQGIAAGVFHTNLMLESITLPTGVTEIPEKCFYGCKALKEVHAKTPVTAIGDYAFFSVGMEKADFPEVTAVGYRAFYRTSIKEAAFPSLENLGASAFSECYSLVSAEVGDIAALPQYAFGGCVELQRITSTGNINSIGAFACYLTPKLVSADFVGENLTKIEGCAFYGSGFEYDWASLTECAFGPYATSAQLNETDYWSTLEIKECENSLPTLFCQRSDRWRDKEIGTSGKNYIQGCLLFSFIHAYCGLTGLRMDTVEEFESIVNAVSPGLLDEYRNTMPCGGGYIRTIGEVLGLTVEEYDTFDAESLQALYDALAEGKYAILGMSGGNYTYVTDEETENDYKAITGHAVMVYGVRPDGRLLVADSAIPNAADGARGMQYALHHKNFSHPTAPDFEEGDTVSMYILSKEDIMLKDIENKLSGMMENDSRIEGMIAAINSGFRTESGQYVQETDSAEVTKVSIPCSAGAKLLVFEADADTTANIQATDGSTKWAIGFAGQCLSDLNPYTAEVMRGLLTHIDLSGSTVYGNNCSMRCWNDEGFSFNTYALKAGTYNWTAYYWDE